MRIFDTHDEMSKATAEVIADTIKSKPDCMICVAAGHTQIETLDYLVEMLRGVDCSRVKVAGLDEWVGYAEEDSGSCIAFIGSRLLKPLAIPQEHYFFFDGKSADLDEQCRLADAFLDNHGGIDLTILGVGMNGHLGFNEPGASLESRSHIRTLDGASVNASQKYFGKQIEVSRGITLGFKDLFASRRIIVQCTGTNKCEIAQKFAYGDITPQIPASLVRNLPQAEIFLDKAAAGDA